MRYLSGEQLKANLNIGKSIEQWLSYHQEANYAFIKWLRIDRERNGQYSVAYFESFDDGDQGIADIYEFSVLHADDPYGIINSFDSAQEALNFAIETYGASPLKFVIGGMIQDEYLDFINSKQPQ